MLFYLRFVWVVERIIFSKEKRLESISFLTYEMIPPPLESRPNLWRVRNPSIKKFPFGKLSSMLVSEIIKISVFPSTCVAKNSGLFLIEFIFKWAKFSLFTLSPGRVYSVLFFGSTIIFKITLFKISIWITFINLSMENFRYFIYKVIT